MMYFSILIFLYPICIHAADSGFEYLEPGPNYIRVCCGVINISAWELSQNIQTNTTSAVPVFTDTPASSLSIGTFKLNNDNNQALTGQTLAFGADTKLESHKIYVICMITMSNVAVKKCIPFRPCQCSTCKPWMIYNITNVPASSPSFIQVWSAPTFPNGYPPVSILIKFRLWDGFVYKPCKISPQTGPGCEPLELHPDTMNATTTYSLDTVVWPGSSNANFNRSVHVKDEILNTVTAEIEITMMLSSISGVAFENTIISSEPIGWNRNDFKPKSAIFLYATPTQKNSYSSETEDAVTVCQKVEARKGSDSVSSISQINSATTGQSVVSNVSNITSASNTTSNTTARPAVVNATVQNSQPASNSTGSAARDLISQILTNNTDFNVTKSNDNGTGVVKPVVTIASTKATVAQAVTTAAAPTTTTAKSGAKSDSEFHALFLIFAMIVYLKFQNC